MLAQEFQTQAESGQLPIDSHDRVLHIAVIYMDEGLWDGAGVFDVVEKLHAHGWSFGQGAYKFNRTLDIFYLTQIGAASNRSYDADDEFPSVDEFDAFYAQYHDLLGEDSWKHYFSPAFLAQDTSARFYRLPNLRDLTDADSPIGQRRQKAVGHWTKLPCWAHTVGRVHQRQPALPMATIVQLALSTLQQTTARLRQDCPDVVPYSETQARFWLHHMNADENSSPSHASPAVLWGPKDFGMNTGRGLYDVWKWEAYYSPERWMAVDEPCREPDLDGTRKSEIMWSGCPDGGTGEEAWRRGWDPEVGSDEEIAFMAAVAVQETEGVDESRLDYTMRSHMVLGVLRLACQTEAEREKLVEDLKRQFVEAGRLKEDRAEPWIRQALLVMEPYGQAGHGWPIVAGERSALLRKILVENGQLFAQWKYSPHSKEFDFKLEEKK